MVIGPTLPLFVYLPPIATVPPKVEAPFVLRTLASAIMAPVPLFVYLPPILTVPVDVEAPPVVTVAVKFEAPSTVVALVALST